MFAPARRSLENQRQQFINFLVGRHGAKGDGLYPDSEEFPGLRSIRLVQKSLVSSKKFELNKLPDGDYVIFGGDLESFGALVKKKK